MATRAPGFVPAYKQRRLDAEKAKRELRIVQSFRFSAPADARMAQQLATQIAHGQRLAARGA